jgi:copper chaperone CopZ
MKSSFLYTLLMIVAVAIFSSSASAQTAGQPQAAVQNLQTIKLKVSGITCSGDCKDIQKVLADIKGVNSSKHIGKPTATTLFEVTFNPAVVSEKELRKAVEDTPGCENPDDRPYKVKKG